METKTGGISFNSTLLEKRPLNTKMFRFFVRGTKRGGEGDRGSVVGKFQVFRDMVMGDPILQDYFSSEKLLVTHSFVSSLETKN